MDKLNENIGAVPSRDFTRGLPFYGTKGDFNFTSSRSNFTPGISIKQVPLTDMSVSSDPGQSELDSAISKLKLYFRPGNRVRGIVVNSQIGSEKGKTVIGKIVKIEPNYSNGDIRCWIRDPRTNKQVQVYVDTIEKVYESSGTRAMSFSQFINS